MQTSAIPTRNTAIQTQPRRRNVAVQAGNNQLSVALGTFEAILGTDGCSYPAIDAIVTRVEDWLSRQASLSTDTGSTSDYEPTDMSCDEDGDKEGRDGVFVSPTEPDIHIPSPVVSGASNISEGSLSDVVSRSPSDHDKNEVNASQQDYNMYSPSHPLESCEEYEEEESCLPSPPPPPSTSTLLTTSPPPPPSASPSMVPKGLPPWARTMAPAHNPLLHVDNTSGGKADTEEAFADEMLEEHLTKSKRPLESVEGRRRSPSTHDADDNEDRKHSEQDCATSETVYKETEPPSSKRGLNTDPETVSGSDKKRKLVTGEVTSSSSPQPTQERPSKFGDLSPSVQDGEDKKESSTGVGARERGNLKSTGHRGEVEQTSRSTMGSKSHSDSPRRSVRQRQRSEKVQATTKTLSSKTDKLKPDRTEADGTHDMPRGKPHKYETRHKKRSEVEEEKQKRTRVGEERRELRSRRKYHSDDSGNESRELRPRSRGGNDDSKRIKGKRGQCVDQTVQEKTKQRQEQSNPSTTSGKKEKIHHPMVPTLQAFEDESMEFQETSMSCENVTPAVSAKQLPALSKVTKECINENTKSREEVDDECYLRSVSLPPFKVGQSSSPTKSKSFPNGEPATSPTLSPRSISNSPPTSAVMRKKPTLTKDELLAMVRAKKKSIPSKASPDANPSEGISLTAEKPSDSMEKGSMVRSQLDMKEMMVNFHNHMRAVSARKVNDASWIHPWSLPLSPSDPSSGVVISFPRKFSLLNPPPPPPGPPPGLPPDTPSVREHDKRQPQQTEALPEEQINTVEDGEVTEDADEKIAEDVAPPQEEMLQDNVIESVEMRVTEETVECALSEGIEETTADRVQKDVFTERVSETLAENLAKETIGDLVDAGVAEKVRELMHSEDILQERTLESVEEMICREIILNTTDKVLVRRVFELIQAESILQERVLDTVEAEIIKEILTSSADEQISKKVRATIQAEEVVRDQALRVVEGSIVEERIESALSAAIDRRVAKLIQSEEFLQERAVTAIEADLVEETALHALSDVIDKEDKVTERIQSELCDMVTQVVEEGLLQIFGEMVVSQMVVEEETIAGVVTILEEGVMGSLKDTVVCNIVEEEEKTVLQLEETVFDRVENEVLDQLGEEIVQELVVIEENKVEGCLCIIEDEILSELQCAFAVKLNEQALEELEGTTMRAVEDQCFEGILQLLIDDIFIQDLEIRTVQKLYSILINELEGMVVEEMVVKEEKCVEMVVADTTSLTEEEILNSLEYEVASDEADREERVSLGAEEKMSELLENELVSLLQETAVAEKVEQTIVEELTERVLCGLEESCLDALIGDAASEKVTSQDEIAANLEERVSGELEVECVNEMVTVAAKEFAVLDVVEEVILNEVEKQIAKEDIYEGSVKEVLEESIMDALESATAATVAEEEHRSRVTYDITEVIPDYHARRNSHVHVMDEPDNQVMYDVTEVVPDLPTHLHPRLSPTFVQIIDPDPFSADPNMQESTSVLTGSPAVVSAQPTATYVHVIETPEQLCSEELPEATDSVKPPETTDIPQTEAADGDAEKHTASTEEGVVSSPAMSPCSPSLPLPVFHPTLPKYISQCLRLRPTKLTGLASPPSGITRPTPLSPTSSKHKVVGVPPDRVKQPKVLSPEQTRHRCLLNRVVMVKSRHRCLLNRVVMVKSRHRCLVNRVVMVKSRHRCLLNRVVMVKSRHRCLLNRVVMVKSRHRCLLNRSDGKKPTPLSPDRCLLNRVVMVKSRHRCLLNRVVMVKSRHRCLVNRVVMVKSRHRCLLNRVVMVKSRHRCLLNRVVMVKSRHHCLLHPPNAAVVLGNDPQPRHHPAPTTSAQEK